MRKVMSVEMRGTNVAVLNHADCTFEVSTFQCNDETQIHSKIYKLKKDFFEVYSPFYTDSQSQRIVDEANKSKVDSHLQKETSAQRKRRKKKRQALPEHEEKLCASILARLEQVKEKAAESGLFLVANDGREENGQAGDENKLLLDNNKTSRLAASIEGCRDSLQEMCEASTTTRMECYDTYNPANNCIQLDDQFLSLLERLPLHHLIHSLVENPCNTGVYLKVNNETFLVPARSRFIMSSFSTLIQSGLMKSLAVQDGYDLVVMDPPWVNKSVKRKKSYNMFDERELFSLPITSLVKPNGLVCLWVTNNDRLLSFVKEELFPAWNVTLEADWLWMKVTRFAEPVLDIRSPHKKPYEKLIIGRRMATSECHNNDNLNNGASRIVNETAVPECNTNTHAVTHTSTSSSDNVEKCESAKVRYFNNLKEKLVQNKMLSDETTNLLSEEINDRLCEKEKEEEKKEEAGSFNDNTKARDAIPSNISQDIPPDYMLVSVPCSLHSKKPPLSDILTPYLPPSPACLELFARNLLPGWTSWGNEVLKHQHIDFYQEVT